MTILNNAQKDMMWGHTRDKHGPLRPPSYIQDSAAYSSCKADADRLAGSFAKWSTKMENYFLEAYAIPPLDRATFQGRASLGELKLRTGVPQPVAALTADFSCTWWAATVNNLALLIRLQKKSDASASGLAKLANQRETKC